MRLWKGYSGIEIYNGVIGDLDGSPYSTDKWDMMLSEGRQVWGLANDDSHWDGNYGLGWNVPYVRERTASDVVKALAQGRFYASTGVEIETIEVEGNHISLHTKNARRIVGHVQYSRRIRVVDESHIEITVPDDAKYVRFTCWGEGESFAWAQPFLSSRTNHKSPNDYLCNSLFIE